jgi:hypothetical protein
VLYRAELLPEGLGWISYDCARKPRRAADGVGFEPTRAVNPTRFPIVLLKPLGHPSRSGIPSVFRPCPEMPARRGRERPGARRRVWDSNPRTPFGRDGLANRCRNHLANPPKPSCQRSCPAWARTRTLLIQSQTCCQLHHGAMCTAGTAVPYRRAGDGARTRDPQLGKLMLYQLSYSRNAFNLTNGWRFRYPRRPCRDGRTEEPPVGFEPTTARLRIECSTPELRWRGVSRWAAGVTEWS